MKKYRMLLMNDVRNMVTDPMLMASLIGPLVLLFIVKYGFPPLDDWLDQRYGFQLSAYAAFIASFLLTVIPLLLGSMAGLLMLDDRDENMIAYFGVTPLARNGYFRYRLFLPSLLTLLMCGLFILFSGIADAGADSSYGIVLLMLEAPLLALFLTAFASNKVEGLALSKASGILFLGPVAAYFVPEPWTYVGLWIPSYWPAQSYLASMSGFPAASFGWFAGGLILHAILLAGLLQVFLRRID
ncbi:hypothetical protein [Paenibacillus sp. PL2-23]|uniref:hypothetical protein n=1 Tax=Paenibacillus sp. PL2-23 TaxID=2100729 RepID=UPI0030F6E358